MKHLKTLAIAASLCAGFQAFALETPLKVYDIAVEVDEQAKTLSVAIDFDMPDYKLGRERELIFTPVIISAAGTDSLELDQITIAGRDRWYHYLRSGVLDTGIEPIYRAGTRQRAQYRTTVPFEEWMNKSSVEMRTEKANCCSPVTLVPGDSPHGLTELALINTERPAAEGEFVFAPPVDDAPVEKNIEGKAFVSFVVNRTELKPDYMVNRREIAKILNSIDYVRNDSDAVITGVHIKGFASPEGPWNNNVRLAQGRTQTLSEYVRDQYHFQKGIVTHSYEPEDWEGLRRYMTDSLDFNIDHRAEIIELIDTDMEPDLRDRTIKQRFPADYAVILKEIYPWLRHSDYTVKYRIKVFNTLPELMRIYNYDATRLRPVDFYTIAQQYPTGSPEFLEVMKKAVEVYPLDPMLNLNAANIELLAGNLDAAQSRLAKAGSGPEVEYALGVLAARRKQWPDAEAHFNAARKAGITQADAYLAKIAEIKAHRSVTITTPVTRKTEK